MSRQYKYSNSSGNRREHQQTSRNYVNTNSALQSNRDQQQQRVYGEKTQRSTSRSMNLPMPRCGRGQYVNRKDEENTGIERRRGFRKASRPLVPENKADLEKWIPRVMSAPELKDIAKQCIEVIDEFIKLDDYLDHHKQYNSSNLDHLRQEQRMIQRQSVVKPNEYQELIAQCQANQGKFPGTLYCLKLVIGEKELGDYISQRAWTEEQLKEWNITTDWQVYDKKVNSDESIAPPFIPVLLQEDNGKVNNAD